MKILKYLTLIGLIFAGSTACAVDKPNTTISHNADMLVTENLIGSTPDVVTPNSIGANKFHVNDNPPVLRCFQRGSRIVEEELAVHPNVQTFDLGISTVSNTGQNITVFAIGDSLCLVRGHVKVTAGKSDKRQ